MNSLCVCREWTVFKFSPKKLCIWCQCSFIIFHNCFLMAECLQLVTTAELKRDCMHCQKYHFSSSSNLVIFFYLHCIYVVVGHSSTCLHMFYLSIQCVCFFLVCFFFLCWWVEKLTQNKWFASKQWQHPELQESAMCVALGRVSLLFQCPSQTRALRTRRHWDTKYTARGWAFKPICYQLLGIGSDCTNTSE